MKSSAVVSKNEDSWAPLWRTIPYLSKDTQKSTCLTSTPDKCYARTALWQRLVYTIFYVMMVLKISCSQVTQQNHHQLIHRQPCWIRIFPRFILNPFNNLPFKLRGKIWYAKTKLQLSLRNEWPTAKWPVWIFNLILVN